MSSALSDLAHAMTDAVASLVKWTTWWWIGTDSVDIAAESESTDRIRGLLLPIVVALLVGGLLVQAIRLALERRVNPLVQAGRGLASYALASTLGTVTVAGLMKAGDAFSTWALNISTDKDFTDRMTKILTIGFTNPDTASVSALATIIFSFIGFFVALVQAVMMVFRDGAVLVLVGVLQLAAAGGTMKATQGWFPKVTGWLLAMIFYKPTAAMVYATAFTLVGHGDDAKSVFTGFAMTILAILALPALMSLFNWATGQVSSGSNGGQLLMSAGFALQAMAGLRGGGGGAGAAAGGGNATTQARYVQSRQPPAGGGRPQLPPGGAPTGGDPTGGGLKPPKPPAGGGPSDGGRRPPPSGAPPGAGRLPPDGGGRNGRPAGGDPPSTGGAPPGTGRPGQPPGAGPAGRPPSRPGGGGGPGGGAGRR